jgi:hypothetical protein
MAPDERNARSRILAHEVRQAVIELTSEQHRRLTTIPEVARHLRVTDSYLLLDALEIAASRGWMQVASGIITAGDDLWRSAGSHHVSG